MSDENTAGVRVVSRTGAIGHRVTPQEANPKTIRVRIAVCAAPDGAWSATGSGGLQDDEMASDAQEYMPHDSTIHFIQADIPLPQTIEAEVHPHDDRGSIAAFAQREAARFDRAAKDLDRPGADRCQAIAGELRTFSAQIQRGDDKAEVQS